MSWDLICLKPHPHRESEDDIYAFMHKSSRRSSKPGINAVQFSVKIAPLPFIASNGTGKNLVRTEEAIFHVIADMDSQTLLFDIGKADSALPAIFRGGGVGSLAISELIIWAKQNHPQFNVALNKINPVLLNYPNAELISTRTLQNMGFSVGKTSNGGLQFKGSTAEKLNIHINKNKIEAALPTEFCSGLLHDKYNMSKQLLEVNQDYSALKETLNQSKEAKRSSVPFFAGILTGVVAGAALSSIIFNV